MEFRLLGPLEASRAGESIPLGGPKQRMVLTHLLLRPNQVVPAERLIDEVWGTDAPEAVRSSLQSYVSHLRKALGSERLEGHRQGYVLHVDPAEIDALRFEQLVVEAREIAPADPAAAVRLYTEALSLWRGNALDDLAQQESLRPDISRLEALRMAAVEEKIAAELELGRHAALVPELETLTARNPLSERLWAHLMIALYRSGRQGDALAAFRRARTILDEELGIQPSPDLQRLHQRVLQQEPGLDVGGRPLRGYRVLEQLGAGSFGVVHRAFQPQINREVAIKAVHPDLANDAEFIRRFEVEAQTVARLEHPHIVPLYDYWREPDGAYLVMRLLRGGSVRDALDRDRLDTEATIRVVEQVSLALTMAHRHGVIHRDVKPANILFDDEDNAYLTDFGIAKDIALSRELAHGRTPASLSFYLSPEEARGEAPTTRTDIYSLGLVAYEMLSGRRPPQAVAGTAPALPTVAAADRTVVDDVLARATAADPLDRFENVATFASALREALAMGPAPAISQPLRNPYRGLRAFLEADAGDFFGRETLVHRLVARLCDEGPASRFVTLVGASGGGKSSVVRAGLVPAIRRGEVPGSQQWFVVDMVPARNPFAELLNALHRLAVRPLPPNLEDGVAQGAPDSIVTAAQWVLADHDGELLLLLDQFEELFTLVDDEAVRTRFATALATAAENPRSRVRVVATLRADFLDRPLADPVLADLVAAGIELVTPLRAEEIGWAVLEPAAGVGATVEPALLAEIVAEVGDQPGALPLLQYAMTELFERCSGAVLDLNTYRAIGGVTGALARRADLIYESLSTAAQDAARQLFLRLVMPGTGTEDTRRRVSRGELLSLHDTVAMEEAIDAFGAARLLSFDRDPASRTPTVEVAHEALLREWDLVRGWIDASRDHLRTHRWLQAAAGEWNDAGRDESFLVSGSRLGQLEVWQRDSGLATTPDEAAFIAASIEERDSASTAAALRELRERALERRSFRRLRALVAVLGVAALVAGGLTVYAVDQGRGAQEQARLARARELAAAATANLDVDAERSILLALEAVETTRSDGGGVLPEAEEALHRAISASRIVATFPGLGGLLDWSPDGRVFVTEGPEETGRIDIRDANTGKSVRAWTGHEIDINDVGFSPDGTRLVTAGDDGALRVWSVATGKKIAEVVGSGQVWAPAFSPDGDHVSASWPEENVVRILDVSTGRVVGQSGPFYGPFSESQEGAAATAFSADGRHVAIALHDQQAVSIVDVASGREVATLEGHTSSVSDIDWSPNGRWIATSGTDSTARIWDARTYRTHFTLRGHTAMLIDGDWAPDSRRFVTGSQDGTAKVWSVTQDGTDELVRLAAHDTTGGLGGVAFSPDGNRVMTGDALITAVRIWDVGPSADAELPEIPTDPDHFPAAAFGEDLIATSRAGDAVALWDRTSHERRTTVHTRLINISDIDIDPRGELVAAAGDHGVGAWDIATGATAFRLPTSGFTSGDWSSNGEFLAVSAPFGYGVKILDRTGKTIAALHPAPDENSQGAQFSPDGTLLAVAKWPAGRVDPTVPRVEIWDWRSSKLMTTLHKAGTTASFDPTGEMLVVSGEDGVATLYNVGSGEALRHLRGHTGPVWDAVFSPDGGRIATGGTDATVRLWDAETSGPPVVLRGHTGPVAKVHFSPDGAQLISSAAEGTVRTRLWAVDIDDLIALAREKLTRTLTDDECRQFLHVDSCPE